MSRSVKLTPVSVHPLTLLLHWAPCDGLRSLQEGKHVHGDQIFAVHSLLDTRQVRSSPDSPPTSVATWWWHVFVCKWALKCDVITCSQVCLYHKANYYVEEKKPSDLNFAVKWQMQHQINIWVGCVFCRILKCIVITTFYYNNLTYWFQDNWSLSWM